MSRFERRETAHNLKDSENKLNDPLSRTNYYKTVVSFFETTFLPTYRKQSPWGTLNAYSRRCIVQFHKYVWKKENGVSSFSKKNNLSHKTSSVPLSKLCSKSFKNGQYNGLILSIVNGCSGDWITSKSALGGFLETFQKGEFHSHLKNKWGYIVTLMEFLRRRRSLYKRGMCYCNFSSHSTLLVCIWRKLIEPVIRCRTTPHQQSPNIPKTTSRALTFKQ